MSNFLLDLENLEKDILFKIAWYFKDSLKEFDTSINNSLYFIDKIILPIVISSKQNKSYNPFSDIIEKYCVHILTDKFEKEGYKFLPLGYSSDLTLENKDHILNLDVKTANIENPSDFKNTIPIGINQTSHVAKLKLNRNFLPEPYFVYPTIPTHFKLPDGTIKYILSYGLMFIYPDYKDLIDKIRNSFDRIQKLFINKIDEILAPIISKIEGVSNEKAVRFLDMKSERSSYTKRELIAESIIRGLFIHHQYQDQIIKEFKLESKNLDLIRNFTKELKKLAEDFTTRKIKPIAIIAISIPNGLLKDAYVDKFRSGKNYSKSARYHYHDGIYEIIKKESNQTVPRILFLDLNNTYISKIKRHFKKIYYLDYELKSYES